MGALTHLSVRIITRTVMGVSHTAIGTVLLNNYIGTEEKRPAKDWLPSDHIYLYIYIYTNQVYSP